MAVGTVRRFLEAECAVVDNVIVASEALRGHKAGKRTPTVWEKGVIHSKPCT